MLTNFPLYKLPLYYINKRYNYCSALPLSAVFVTTWQCNLKCRTCFIWKHTYVQNEELTLEEYEKIFRSFGRTYWVTLGGGEPFLREDFLEIALALCRHVTPRIVNIVSNGSQPDAIYDAITKLQRAYPEIRFILNLSLDHIGQRHDEIRMKEGSFSLVCETVKKLQSVKPRNFVIGLYTIISQYNVDDFESIYNWIQDNIRPDTYAIEDAQIREEFKNSQGIFVPKRYDYLKTVKFYLDRLKSERPKGVNILKKAFRIVYYKTIMGSLAFNEQPYNCYAGYSACQINPNGEVWSCATKGFKLGNLKQHNYNFKELWFSPEANQIRKKMKEEKCCCCLSNMVYTNTLIIPRYLISLLRNLIQYC